MERKYPNLCKPLRAGRVLFRNRMFSTPMGGTDIENDGCIGPKSQAFYEYRAKGGAAAVTVSELMVHPATDGSHAYHLDESILNSIARAAPDGQEVLIPGRSVICALGQRSRPWDELLSAAPFVRVIGDAARVSTITNAVYWGYHAALDI